jgi:hypothetical protein
MNALVFELPSAPHVVFEIRIAAVDDGVPGLHVLRQRSAPSARWPAGGNHNPHGARRFQFADEIFQRAEPPAPSPASCFDRVGAQIGNHKLMSAAHQSGASCSRPCGPDLPFLIACFTPLPAKLVIVSLAAPFAAFEKSAA